MYANYVCVLPTSVTAWWTKCLVETTFRFYFDRRTLCGVWSLLRVSPALNSVSGYHELHTHHSDDDQRLESSIWQSGNCTHLALKSWKWELTAPTNSKRVLNNLKYINTGVSIRTPNTILNIPIDIHTENVKFMVVKYMYTGPRLHGEGKQFRIDTLSMSWSW